MNSVVRAILLATAAMLGLPVVSARAAVPCQTSTFDIITATPGFTCSIGDLIYSNFNYNITLFLGNVAAPAIEFLEAIPGASGFRFASGVQDFTATSPGALTATIGYTVSEAPGSTNLITGASINMGFFQPTDPSSFDQLSLNLGVGVAPTAQATNLGFTNTSPVTFPGETSLTAVNTLNILAATGQNAFVGITFVDNSFIESPTGSTSVPEPTTLAMLGLGTMALSFLRRRRGCIACHPRTGIDWIDSATSRS